MKENKLIRDLLGNPIPQHYNAEKGIFIANTNGTGDATNVDFSKIKMLRDLLGSPIPQYFDVGQGKFMPSTSEGGGGSGEVGPQGPPGEKGDPGPPGSDANVTSENITNALGYTPANNTDLTTLDDKVTTHLDEFVQNLSDNGYQKLPNGLIIQWATYGEYGDADQDVTKLVNFPMSFPNRAFNVSAVIYSNTLTLKRYIQVLSNNDSQISFVAKGVEAIGGENTGMYYVKVIAMGN